MINKAVFYKKNRWRHRIFSWGFQIKWKGYSWIGLILKTGFNLCLWWSFNCRPESAGNLSRHLFSRRTRRERHSGGLASTRATNVTPVPPQAPPLRTAPPPQRRPPHPPIRTRSPSPPPPPIVTPLLEMGFSMQAIKKAITKTGNYDFHLIKLMQYTWNILICECIFSQLDIHRSQNSKTCLSGHML